MITPWYRSRVAIAAGGVWLVAIGFFGGALATRGEISCLERRVAWEADRARRLQIELESIEVALSDRVGSTLTSGTSSEVLEDARKHAQKVAIVERLPSPQPKPAMC